MVVKNDKLSRGMLSCVKVPEACFLCGERIDAFEGSVFWNGSTNIILHQECAERFAVRIAHDSIGLQKYLRENNS